jgi:SAM-dependent methyltransferase
LTDVERATPDAPEKFDSYARDYLSLHKKNIAITGEEPVYFAKYKLACLERLLGPTFDAPVLDYGCGVGPLTEQLVTRFTQVHAFDPSRESIALASARAPRATFYASEPAIPDGHFGLAVLSCVLHHIPPAQRPAVLETARAKLRPDGRLVIFEHNPLNPLTRRAVAQCPFDDDAILLWPGEACRLLKSNGFRDVRRDFIVFLPRALARLRWLEPHLRAIPIGAQMMLVGTRAP